MDDILDIINNLNQQIVLYEKNQTNISSFEDDNIWDSSENLNNSYQFESKNCTSTLTSGAVWSQSIRVFLIVLYGCTLFASLFGNVAVILVHRACHYCLPPFENIRICLLNLALSDIVIGVFCAPLVYTNILLGKWIFPAWLCPVAQFAQLMSIFVSTNTLMIIGVERYLALYHPFSNFYRRLRSIPLWLMLLTWFFGAIYAYIPFRSLDWTINGSNRKLLITVNFLLTFAIPLTILIVTYSAIMIKLFRKEGTPLKFWVGIRKQDTRQRLQSSPVQGTIDSTQNSRQTILIECDYARIYRQKNLSKTIKMTFIIILLYGLCWSPVKVYQLLHQYRVLITLPPVCDGGDPSGYYIKLYLYTAFHWLAMANTFMNPLVYTFSSRRFRVKHS